MQFNIYSKQISTGKITHEKIVDVPDQVYASNVELAKAIMKVLNLAGMLAEVSTLKSGKMDLCFKRTRTENKDIRFMCYKLHDQTASIKVSPRRICDLLIGAFEGGSTYWAQQAHYVEPKRVANNQHWYDMPELFTAYPAEEIFKIKYDDPEKPEGNGKGVKVVTMNDIQKGLNVMANKYASHFGDFVSENDDSITADVFLQCVVLGDVIYG